jgi:hypothetical protein
LRLTNARKKVAKAAMMATVIMPHRR